MFSCLGVYTVWVPLLIQLIGMHSMVYSKYDTVRNVTSCPITERGWKIRKNDFNCKEGQLLAYHCLLDEKGKPKEVCLKRKEYTKGCPWVLLVGEEGYFGNPLTSCNDNKYCPDGTKRFSSDQLYNYPACFAKEEDRENFTLPKVFDIPEIKDDTIKSQSTFDNCTRKADKECPSCASWVIPIYASVLATVSGLLGLSVYFIMESRNKTKRRNTDAEHKRVVRKLKNKKNIYLQMILRSVIQIIKSGDNPSLLEDIYDTLDYAKTETYLYEKNFPIFENEKVPYLIYAAKLNRLQIVQFYLRRYVGGSDLCGIDVYGSDEKNMNIKDLAVQKGWSDVVQTLLDIDPYYF